MARSAALLAAAVIAGLAGCGPTAEEVRLRRRLAVVQAALKAFTRDCGRPPTKEEGLPALVHRPFNPDVTDRWRGPYLRSDQIRNRWERLYAYALLAREDGRIEPRVWGVGLDSVPYTSDDAWPPGTEPPRATRPGKPGP